MEEACLGDPASRTAPRVLIVAGDLDPRGLASSYRARRILDLLPENGLVVAQAAARANARTPERTDTGGADPGRVARAFSLLRRGIAAGVSLPDRTIWNSLAAARRVRSNAWREGLPDAVLVTTPPHTLVLAGLGLQRRTGAALVLDFRDDWITNDRLRFRTPAHRWVAARLERLAVAAADAVILNTRIVAGRFAERYPQAAGKLFVVPNAYDERDFSGLEIARARTASGGPIVLGYFGSAYDGFATETLRRIAVRIRDKGLEDRIRLATGGMGPWRGAGLAGVWEHAGPLSEKQAAERMTKSDVLLLLMPPGEREPSGTVPLKAYSYLRSGAFVVYAGEKGATSDLLNAFPRTACFDREALETIPEWCLENVSTIRQPAIPAGIEAFEAAQMVRQIARIVHGCVEAKAPAKGTSGDLPIPRPPASRRRMTQ